MAHENNRHQAHDRRSSVWTLVLAGIFAGALLIGLQSTVRWAAEAKQQLELTIPEWIPRLILENAMVAFSRILS
jgi:hypothetical protein